MVSPQYKSSREMSGGRGPSFSSKAVLLMALASSTSGNALPATDNSNSQSQSATAANPIFISPVSGGRLHWDGDLPTTTNNNNNNNNKSSTSRTSVGRHLASGDFASLNALFEGATIDLPKAEFSVDASDGIITRTLDISDLSCSKLSIGDIILEATSSNDIIPQTKQQQQTGTNNNNNNNNGLPVVTVLDLGIVDFDFQCDMTYKVDIKAFPDLNGKISVASRNNRVSTQFILESSTTTLEISTATGSSDEDCKAQLNVNELDFDGNAGIDWLFNAAEGLARDQIATYLEGVVCEELQNLAIDTLPTLLDQVTDSIAPYLADLDASQTNPLRDEELLVVVEEQTTKPMTSNYIDFTNSTSSSSSSVDGNNSRIADMAHFLLDTIDQADAWLGSTIDNEDGNKDLGINVMMRALLLDDAKSFVWDFASSDDSSSKSNNNISVDAKDEGRAGLSNIIGPIRATETSDKGMMLLESHDELLQMEIRLDSVDIQGLDSMTKFETFDRIGKHTLQNTMAWKYLSANAALSLRIAPSTQDNALWTTTIPDLEILETFTLSLSADDIQAVISVFMAIDQDRLGQVPLGALFRAESIAPCLFSTIYQGHLLSGLDLAVSNLIDPTMEGFTNEPGMDRILTEAMDLMYNLYEHWVIDAIPNFSQTTVREGVNDAWVDFVGGIQTDRGGACPLTNLATMGNGQVTFLDFRDLLLPADEAREMGTPGSEPYGDFVAFVYGLIQDQLLVVDENDPNKRLRLNSMVIDPLTKLQSGEEGALHFESNLASFVLDKGANAVATNTSMFSEMASELFDYLEFRLYDTKIRNINTIIGNASHMLKPSSDDPHLLGNLLKFGPIPENDLNVSVRVLLGISGDPEELPPVVQNTSGAGRKRRLNDAVLPSVVEHIMDISVSAASLEVLADVVVMADAKKLLAFPLEDITNPYCWLATIPAPRRNNTGRALSLDAVRSVGVKLGAFLAGFSNLDLGVQCVNDACSNGGLGVLMELTDIWKKSNVTATLGNRYEALATELLMGDYGTKQMSWWLEEAPAKCPHDREYSVDAPAGPALGLPVFSLQSIDTIVFTALTAAQAGLLVLSESSLGASSGSTSEPAKVASATSNRLIDFTNVSGGMETIADLMSYLVSQANTLLGPDDSAAGIDNTRPRLGINDAIASMLDENGDLDLQFDGMAVLEESNLRLRLNSLRIGGLDSFTAFNILEATSPQMLENSVTLSNMTAEINVSIESGPIEASNSQELVLKMVAEDIKVSLPMLAAIDADSLDSLELGSLLDLNKMLPCIFTAVEKITIDGAELRIGNITDISVTGLLPASNDAFVRSMTAVAGQFGVGINEFLDPIIQSVLNGVLSYNNKNAKCDNIMLSKASSRRLVDEEVSIDFRDLLLSETTSTEYGGSGESPYGNLFRTVLSFVQNLVIKVDPATGLSSINEMIIAPLTKSLSSVPGSIVMADTIVDVENRLNIGGLNALITFRASNARLENLDTMGSPLSLLAPVANEPLLLNNTATMGVPNDRPLRLSVRLLLGLEDDDTQMRNDVELSFDLQAATMALTAMIQIVETEFATFPLRDILNLDCWLAKIPAPSLDKYGFREEGVERSAGISQLVTSISDMGLGIKCFNCTSPGLRDFNTEGSQDLEVVMKRVINYATTLLGGKFLQLQIDRALNNAAKQCPHSPRFDTNFLIPEYATFESSHDPSMTFLLMILVVTAIAIAILVAVIVALKWIVRTRHRRLLRSLPDKELYLLQKEQQQEDKRNIELNAVTRSLFQSEGTIPAFVRFVVPLVILINIGFFLSGHLSLGATVNISAQLAGEEFQVDGFFSFSMAQSTIDIWNAGGRALAAMIFIFSGLWPYTKSIMTLVLWFTPPSTVCMATRGSTLEWLDTLAKWSMVDIFVMFVSLAGFRISIASPGVDFLPDNFYSVDLLVVPMWGLYANMVAQVISQMSSHAIIHYHRQVEKKASRARHALFCRTVRYLEDAERNNVSSLVDEGREAYSLSSSSNDSDADSDQLDQLYKHAFVRPHSDNSKLVARGYVNPILMCCSLALAALLIAGCALPSFSLEVMGVMGVLVESGNQWNAAVEEHSVFTIAELLMDQAEFLGGVGDYIGLGAMASLLIFTVLLAPLIQTMALLYHWFAPMNKKTRRRMEVLLEGTQAWQYVEVYLVATLVACWQLGPISDFMINSYCGSLDDTFAMLVYYGILKESDGQCFRVEASIGSAAYMLAASAILLGSVNAYIRNASRQYFRDVENKSKEAIVPYSTTTETVSAPTVANLDTSSAAANTSCSKPSRPGLESPGNSVNGDDLSTNEAEGFTSETDPLARPIESEEERWQRRKAMEEIHPVPVLFTDKFRWTLMSQDDTVAEAASLLHKENESTDQSDSEEAQSLLMSKGDAPETVPTTRSSSCDDDGGGDDEGFLDEAELIRTQMTVDNGEWESPSKYQTDKAEESWESDGESNNSGSNHHDGSVADTDAETALSVFETVGNLDTDTDNQSVSTHATTNSGDFATAREEDDVLLGAGSVRLEAVPMASANDEAFDDELDFTNDAQERNKPSKPQGNCLLQAAFLEDDPDDLLPVSRKS